jgi:hypothetical protein
MFAGVDRLGDDLDLLHDARRQFERLGAATAVGANGQRIYLTRP